jgi:type VI secretion system secreted protein Hcp
VGRGISTPVGTSSKREASAPSISEVVVSKTMDSSSTAIFNEACVGTAQEVKIDLVETGADQLNTYLEVTLTNAMISGYSVSSGGDRPSESISFNFTKIVMRYTPYDDQHKADTSKIGTAGYDLTAGKKV